MWESTVTGGRQYSIPPSSSTISDPISRQRATEELHAWSIYRQNLNSDFTDSALGSAEKSPLPYGNFQLRESTVQTILNHPKYGPNSRQSELGANMYTYLRFGLPRVFPPNKSGRDGSSGYDSSDDGHRHHGRGMTADSDFRRSRSIPNLTYRGGDDHDRVDFGAENDNKHLAGHGHGHANSQIDGRKLRANSEGDLIGSVNDESLKHTHKLLSEWQSKQNRQDLRDSEMNFEQHRATPIGHVTPHTNVERRSDRGSKVGSHVSQSSRKPVNGNLSSHGERLLLNDKIRSDSVFSSLSQEQVTPVVSKHPHLQVRNVGFEVDRSPMWKRLCGLARVKQRVLDGLSFEVRGGEVLGVMCTNDNEGKTLLDLLANRHSKWRTNIRGEFIVNGLVVKLRKLSDRVAYAQQDINFTPDISVRQTLLFMSLLQESGNSTRSFDTKGRIDALIEDLGLSQVKHTRVKNLTLSEKRRLNVACHLLLDTDIVLLDQPTKNMDIFDTYFLMEYLKTWSSRGRIIILTIHPPTYEVFSMLSKVALISTGRMMYFGKRKEMLPYFAYVDYPCPAYKNPSDYYLDLITLDNLSAEAMLESSQRVENLVELFKQRQELMSDPGPPSVPPSKMKRSSFAGQVVALWIRVLIYMFPYNLIHVFGNCILTALMSVLIGLIFWNVRQGIEQEHVNDRFGFYYVMMGLGLWPNLLYTISKESNLKPMMSKDVKDRLYWKVTYILTKICYNFFSSGLIFLAYIIPSYAMAGLREEAGLPAFGIYVGYMLLYLYTVHMVATVFAYAYDSRHLAAGTTGFIFTLVALTCGYTCHVYDLSPLVSWFHWASPMKWMIEQLNKWEFHGESTSRQRYQCTRNPVRQDNAIVVKSDCGVQTASDALKYMGNEADRFNTYVSVLITLGFYIVFHIFAIVFFTCFKQSRKNRRQPTK